MDIKLFGVKVLLLMMTTVVVMSTMIGPADADAIVSSGTDSFGEAVASPVGAIENSDPGDSGTPGTDESSGGVESGVDSGVETGVESGIGNGIGSEVESGGDSIAVVDPGINVVTDAIATVDISDVWVSNMQIPEEGDVGIPVEEPDVGIPVEDPDVWIPEEGSDEVGTCEYPGHPPCTLADVEILGAWIVPQSQWLLFA